MQTIAYGFYSEMFKWKQNNIGIDNIITLNIVRPYAAAKIKTWTLSTTVVIVMIVFQIDYVKKM